MISPKQKTIQKELMVSGYGLHTNCKVNLKIKPAAENTGIQFVRLDLLGHPAIKADPSSVSLEQNVQRCTSIGTKEVVIHTVEHLMSAFCGLGITNATVELDAVEVPGLDGSGKDFVEAIKRAGIFEQNAEAAVFTVREPIGVSQNGSSIYVFPSSEFKISYLLDYPHPLLRSQFFNITVNSEAYEKDIAPCRTFCLEKEAQELRKLGLGQGANFQNTLVVGEKGVIENHVRFSDEFARHKVLDFIGDLYLLGVPLRGHVYAVKSGHNLNWQLLKKLYELKKKEESKWSPSPFNIPTGRVIDSSEIMKILPHRYPFLLVDRVIELEKGKRGLGIKNVTINDNFFEGHFPSRPVMPGVIMVEAMAQAAGVVVLTGEEHHGKVAFFMAADNVKFRKVVVPGDQIVMEIEVVKDRSRIAQVRAVAKVQDEVVAEADMVFSFTDASYLD